MTTEPRNQQLHFRVTSSERSRIEEKMKQAGIRSIGVYLRKMALDGYCVKLELQELRELVRLLGYCSNNLNQYARRANSDGSIYHKDIEDLQLRLDQIWDLAKQLTQNLSELT